MSSVLAQAFERDPCLAESVSVVHCKGFISCQATQQGHRW